MDILSIVVILLVAVWFALAVRHIFKNRGNGCCGNCKNCSGCAAKNNKRKPLN